MRCKAKLPVSSRTSSVCVKRNVNFGRCLQLDRLDRTLESCAHAGATEAFRQTLEQVGPCLRRKASALGSPSALQEMIPSGELMTLASPAFSLNRGCAGLVSDFHVDRPFPADALLMNVRSCSVHAGIF